MHEHDEGAPRTRAVLVCGVDLRPRSARAIRHTLGMLRSGAAGEAHFVHVLPPSRAVETSLLEAIPRAVGGLVRDVEVPAAPTWAHVRIGIPRFEIRRLAFDVGADLVVVGERAEPDPDDAERHAPFSVLTAGESLVLDSRPFRAQRCTACTRAAALPGSRAPFCPAHARAGVAPHRIDRDVDHDRVVYH
jgi:nucleotide-binding universal stress UspA family protein